jgi:hypothetical protein
LEASDIRSESELAISNRKRREWIELSQERVVALNQSFSVN